MADLQGLKIPQHAPVSSPDTDLTGAHSRKLHAGSMLAIEVLLSNRY